MKPTVAKFDKLKPCTKADLWFCFHPRRKFDTVPVAEAQAIIGANAPRGMEQHKRLLRLEVRGVDCYKLTPTGESWLTAGVLNYAKNHPLEALGINNLPGPKRAEATPNAGRIRLVRASL